MLVTDTRYRTLCWWEIRDIRRYVGGIYEIHDDMLVWIRVIGRYVGDRYEI